MLPRRFLVNLSIVISLVCSVFASTLIEIEKPKDLKKTIATKTNLLVLYAANPKSSDVVAVKNLLKSVDGSFAIVDCSEKTLKKQVCKKALGDEASYVLKHYKDGTFNKDYDRQLTKNSMQYFLKDPTGEIPYEEDQTSNDVIHINDMQQFDKLLKRERTFITMFYTNWCGFCKRLKPIYSQVATETKGKHVLVAMDMEKPENNAARRKYNISGFPTIINFDNSVAKHTFEGESTKAGLMEFLTDPSKQIEKPKEEEWAEDENSEVVHLTNDNFDVVLKDEKSAIVMFYANWCGHCKKLKPKYETAVKTLKSKNISGMLAAVDATKERDIGNRYGIKGYPTLKYFVNGELKFDVKYREHDQIVKFMENPEEPPVIEEETETAWEDEESYVEHLNEESFKPFLKKKKHVLVMFYAPWCGHCKRTKPEFVKAAEEFKDDSKVELAAVDCTKHSSVCSAYEVKGYPSLIYFNYLKTHREYNGDRKAEDFIKFLRNPDQPPEVKRNEENIVPFDSKRVMLLDDKTFEETLKREKSMIAMFFTHWCGHCKNLKPIYSKAADESASVGVSTQFAAIDCGAHSALCKKFNIEGYPTVKFFKNGKFSKDYSQARKADAIIQFLKTNTEDIKDEL